MILRIIHTDERIRVLAPKIPYRIRNMRSSWQVCPYVLLSEGFETSKITRNLITQSTLNDEKFWTEK